MKHTQGGWKVEDTDEEGNIWIRIPGHDIFIGNIEDTCGECYANARLIAAAPKLAAMLSSVLKTYQPCMAEYDVEEIETLLASVGMLENHNGQTG